MTGDRQRIDKWLFFARVTKSRSLAAKLVQAGRVRVNGDKVDQVSQPVKVGDTLTITLDRQIRVLRIAAPGARRGPFEEAKALYDDLTPTPKSSPVLSTVLPPARRPGTGRPTKRDRRRIDAWKEVGEE